MVLNRSGVDEIQPHPSKDLAPNSRGEIALNKHMKNGFIMVGSNHTPFLSIVNNNTFIKQSLPCR
jgi:hypothetical protein